MTKVKRTMRNRLEGEGKRGRKKHCQWSLNARSGYQAQGQSPSEEMVMEFR